MKRLAVLIVGMILGIGAMRAQTEASYPGGQEAMNAYIIQTIHYPQDAIDNMIEGTVVVAFDVETDGTLHNVQVVHPLDPDLEAEAIRVVVSMPKWIPATNASGVAIVQRVEIPVAFRLPY